MLLTVKVTYKDGTTDIKECHNLSEIHLDNVESIKILREEDEITHCPISSNQSKSSSKNSKSSNKQGNTK